VLASKTGATGFFFLRISKRITAGWACWLAFEFGLHLGILLFSIWALILEYFVSAGLCLPTQADEIGLFGLLAPRQYAFEKCQSYA
jgi:hypothetical protein